MDLLVSMRCPWPCPIWNEMKLKADEKTAKEVIAKLDNGEDFAELATKYSTDSTAESGGSLGYFEKGVMDEAFEEAAFALEIGKYSSKPVETDEGYHVIKVTDHTKAKEATYEEVKKEIKQTLNAQKTDEYYTTWIQGIMENYKVENYLAES